MSRWLRVETDFPDHPKVIRLATALDASEAEAGWYVLRMWSWVSRYCPTGHVRGTEADALEAACRWRGDRGQLAAALRAVEWLDDADLEGEPGWMVHDWLDHQGAVASKAAKERDRKRRYRERLRSGAASPVPRDTDGTERGTGASRPALRNVTGRDGTSNNDGADVPLTPPRPAARGRTQPRQRRLPIVDVPPTPPRPAAPSDMLVAEFAAAGLGAYLWQGAKDGKALAELLKGATLDEVIERWRRGLAAPAEAWASCRTVAQLKQKWNDLAPRGGSPPPPAPKLDEVTAEAVDRVLKGYPDHVAAYVAGQISQNLRWRRDGDELIGETEDKYFVEWCLEHYPTLGELGMRVALVGGGAAA